MECRFANKRDLEGQKRIWKETFGDEDIFVDYYYEHRYQADETVLLTVQDDVAAMLTMLPVKIILPEEHQMNAAMIYAVATHPRYQGRGYATQLMEFSGRHLQSLDVPISLLVPAEETLFDFYRKRGYQTGFSIREAVILHDQILSFAGTGLDSCRIEPADPAEYNRRRKDFLKGRKYVSYSDREISYQKDLSVLSGSDIYSIDIGSEKGCLAAERISEEKVIIKEMLLSEEHLEAALMQLSVLLDADEYLLRTPEFLIHRFGGTVRPFGMVKAGKEAEALFQPEEPGYLGIAFD